MLVDLFYKKAECFPNKVAIWCEDKHMTYQSFAHYISQYANFLNKNGIAYGDHIGVPMHNSIESVALIFAAATLGVGLVPINPTLPDEAIRTIFKSSHVKHLIARQNFLEAHTDWKALGIDGTCICIDAQYPNTLCLKDLEQYSIERLIIKQVDGNETWIITTTSGSTGQPKPIRLTQNDKYKRAKVHIDLYDITEDDVILAATPLYHSLAERLVIMPLLMGGTSVLMPRFTPSLWLDTIDKRKVTFTIAVSAQLSQVNDLLKKENKWSITSLRCCVSSSALLNTETRNELISQLPCAFHEMYGTSETSTVTDISYKETILKNKSVGRALKEAIIKIVDDRGKEVPQGEIGEIICKSALICSGYYKQDTLFQNSLIEGYFKTGDMGYIDADGYLYYSGRKKEMIITGGINVYPPDIEDCLLKLEGVIECAAFAYPDEKLGEVVAVMVKGDKELKLRKIRFHCAKYLADFQQPHKIFIVEDLPRNAMGKVMKNQLLEYSKALS